ncbi:MAG: PsiF family protein [Aquabacterium sp.]
MKLLSTVAALALAAFAVSSQAASHAASGPSAQQNKMGECNAKAGDKKGDERKKFMSECLSAKKTTQQDKMKSCNASAGDKKGEDRKKHMSECLKG